MQEVHAVDSVILKLFEAVCCIAVPSFKCYGGNEATEIVGAGTVEPITPVMPIFDGGRSSL
jgi:hypothetical protein